MCIKQYCAGSTRRGTSYIQLRGMKGNWIGHILSSNCLLKQVIKGHREGIRDAKMREKK